MKYKIGQKVRVIEPSKKLCDERGRPFYIGHIGLIRGFEERAGYYPIFVEFDIGLSEGKKKVKHNYFEDELEPIIQIGEQLVFEFMKE